MISHVRVCLAQSPFVTEALYKNRCKTSSARHNIQRIPDNSISLAPLTLTHLSTSLIIQRVVCLTF